jgi:thymidine kinase
VIAEQEHRFDAVAAIGAKPFDHFRRVRAAINEVADEYEEHFMRWASRQLRMDFRKELIEKVKAAVNVPDGVRTPAMHASRTSVSSGRMFEHRAFGSMAFKTGKQVEIGADYERFAKLFLNLSA